jgi:hypothetical protein
MAVAERLAGALDELGTDYVLLFASTERGQGHAASAPAASGELAAPARLDVIDTIRRVNTEVLGARWSVARAMGYGEYAAGPVDVAYRRALAVTDAIDWLGAAAHLLEHEGLARELLDWLLARPGGLLLEVRRVLGLAEPPYHFKRPVPCPIEECPGELFALPLREVILCQACGTRWDKAMWRWVGKVTGARGDPEAAVAS